MSTSPTFLDVENDEQRENRISSLLEGLNTTSPSKSAAPSPLLNVGRETVIGPTEPPAELLARVQSFLTAIATSNETLSRENPDDIDIENVPENTEEYIEMNLGLGVFETKHRKSGSRSVVPSPEATEPSSDETSSESESSCSDSEECSESSSSSSDSDSDSDSDSESQSGSSVDVKSRPIKPLPRRASQQKRVQV